MSNEIQSYLSLNRKVVKPTNIINVVSITTSVSLLNETYDMALT
jgi:hypothetical protein